MKKPFVWDSYSDQPYPLGDKIYKKKMRKKHLWDYVPLVLSNIILFPFAVLVMKFFRGKEESLAIEFYGMGVDLDKGDIQVALIKELGLGHILVRMPLWEMHRIDDYVDFIQKFQDVRVLVNILQDREHIEDKALLQKDIQEIFEKFSPYVGEYQIGNAINRTKWGFFSMKEYLIFYQEIQKLRDKKYPKLKLIGSSVIDFEFHYSIRTLFHFFSIKYDRFSSLLYVDRRGSPHNKQMGIFDTKNKINMLYALVRLSPKSSNDIYITEVNWPLLGTAPYAPTSEKECVSEEDYAQFMQEYLEISKESQKIKRVYWHQLIASGYGLVDHREGIIRKTKAFEVFKAMIKEDNERTV